jgi:acetyl-CoA carboxylase biotin carboxyl carrier protein
MAQSFGASNPAIAGLITIFVQGNVEVTVEGMVACAGVVLAREGPDVGKGDRTCLERPSPPCSKALHGHTREGSMADIKVVSEIAGKVWLVETKAGAQVAEGDTLIVLESMKMEIPVAAPSAGIVKSILVAKDDAVKEGQILVVMAG